MALDAAIARRYARAFCELADEEQASEVVARDMERLRALVSAADGELVSTLSNPVFTLAERQVALRAALERLRFHPLLGSMLELLLAKNRFAWLPQVIEAWRERTDRAAGRVRASVTTARPLTPELLQQVRQALSQATGAQVELTTHTDASLLAGLVVKLGDSVYDASLRARLVGLEKALLNTYETSEA